jgi:hypothetical protein
MRRTVLIFLSLNFKPKQGDPMKQVLMTALIVLGVSSAFAKDGYDIGNCQVAAQKAAKAIAKINGAKGNFNLHLQGSPNGVETYQDEDGYFEIITVAGRGEGQCRVEELKFNPEP